MNNNSNIYDIDGQLIRSIDDTDHLTVEEAEKRLNEYQEKIKQLTENQEVSEKIAVYNTYVKNLQDYILRYYITHPEEAKIRLSKEEEIRKAMEQLKADVAKEEAEEEPKETVMDEYVDFEETKEDETD